jgi:hypothetical protein
MLLATFLALRILFEERRASFLKLFVFAQKLIREKASSSSSSSFAGAVGDGDGLVPYDTHAVPCVRGLGLREQGFQEGDLRTTNQLAAEPRGPSTPSAALNSVPIIIGGPLWSTSGCAASAARLHHPAALEIAT